MRGRKRIGTVGRAVLAVLALVAGCSGAERAGGPGEPPPPSEPPTTTVPPTTASTAPARPLAWRSCGGRFECADLEVPLDHADPAAGNVTLAVKRQAARRADRRIGSLFVNPGGPGASGVDTLAGIVGALAPTITDRFDVVGWDPRGVGSSRPAVDCVTDTELERYLGIDAIPDTPAEIDQLVAAARTFVDGCQRQSGRLLPHLSTVDVARDLDLLRQAVGDARLTYVGFSYGTSIGAAYAELFPDRVRAMVLDGAVDPSLDTMEVNRQQGLGFDRAFEGFARWCAATAACAWRPAGGPGSAALQALFDRVDAGPLPAGGRTLDPGDAFFGAAAGLYSRRTWPTLAQALARAEAGDGSTLLALADRLAGRGPDGRYDNSQEANPAVNCIDRPAPRDLDAYRAAAAEVARTAPLFAPAVVWSGVVCALWPVPPVGEARPLQAAGAPPILVVGTTNDPATPYEWAEALARQLPAGRLVTLRGEGHTAYLDNACVSRTADAYLVTGADPEGPTTC